MSRENPPNTPEQPSQKTETISVPFESLSALEAMSVKELSIRKQQIEAKIWKLKELDKQQAIAKWGNIYTQSSESDTLIQARNEESLIDKAIQKKAQTIQDVFHDDTISYTPQDVLRLYKQLEPTSQQNDPESAYESLQWQVDIAKDGSKEWWSLDEILEKLKIPKDNLAYRKIIASAFIGEKLKTKKTSADVANAEFDAMKRGIADLSPAGRTAFTNIYQRLSQNDQLLFGEERLITALSSWENYQQTRENVFKELWVQISEEEYNILVGSAKQIHTETDTAKIRAQENQDIQIAALEKWNLVEALQQETKYQRETSQIEYYRDLRSSISKTEWNQINNISSQGNESMIVGSADFSKNLTEFMNDPTVSSIYPKLNDGTTIPIIKSGPDSCVVQGCEVSTESVASLIDINQTLANEWLRFFSTKTPLTKILANMEQALRAKGVQNVPNFGDPQTLANYGDNIVDILYQVIDPNPKEQIANVSERINTAHKRFAGSIPLIAYGRQSGVVREDSSIDINTFTDRLNSMIQSGYPFRFWGDKKEKRQEISLDKPLL